MANPNNNSQEEKKSDKKSKILLILLTLGMIVILLGVFYFFFFYDFTSPKIPKKDKSDQQQQDTSGKYFDPEDKNKIDNNVSGSGGNKTIMDKDDFNIDDLKIIASRFAERFGSYSNHSNFGNIKDLKLFMTEEMKAWADDYLAEKKNEEYSGEYYGIITRAINAQEEAYSPDEGKAEIIVKTQKTEDNNGDKNVYYQNILIKFVNQEGEWKISEAEWQEK